MMISSWHACYADKDGIIIVRIGREEIGIWAGQASKFRRVR